LSRVEFDGSYPFEITIVSVGGGTPVFDETYVLTDPGLGVDPEYGNLGVPTNSAPVDVSAFADGGFNITGQILTGGGGFVSLEYSTDGTTFNPMPGMTSFGNGAFSETSIQTATLPTSTTLIVSAFPLIIPHGVNCHAYNNGGAFSPLFPPGNGLLLGDMTALQNWCRANGISAALNQDTQRACIDLLTELLTVANTAPVYSGATLELIPYDEVSAAGNGAIYIAPTASGPVAYLTDIDFVCDGSTPPVKVERDSRANCDNVVSIEYIDRTIDYAHNAQTATDTKSVALYGTRKGGTLDSSASSVGIPSGAKSMLSISSMLTAQAVASIMVKRSAADLNKHSFTLKPEWFFLEAMDLVCITDTRLGINQLPVRFQTTKETDTRALECEAIDFVYGLNHPSIGATTQATGTLVPTAVDPGVVNAPVIFEPTQGMLGVGAAAQLWFVVSGSDPNYGGCVGFVSIDGGVSYQTLGNVASGTTGVLTADYPVGSDPDTADTLAIDLTESNGSLTGQTQALADARQGQCYLATATANVFESICPTVITLTAIDMYSMTTYARRGVLGTVSIDHPIGSRFAALDGSVFKVNCDPQWVGKVLYFQFAAYNLQRGQQNALGNCAVYTYTPYGLPSTWASMAPATVLSQSASTYVVAMAAFVVTFANETIASYSLRSFAVPDPGTTPQTYYVTIDDPDQLGDGAGTLTAYCDTNATRANTPGYTFAGKIIVTHTGGNNGGSGGPNGINAVLIVVG
jgi:hypothetical protein